MTGSFIVCNCLFEIVPALLFSMFPCMPICMLVALTKRGEGAFLSAEASVLDVFSVALKNFKAPMKKAVRESQHKIITLLQ